MKVLLLGLRAPYPPTSGGQIRRWEILKYLARRYQLTFIYFAPNLHPVPSPLEDLCERAIAVPQPRAPSAQDLHIGRGAPGPVKGFGATAMYHTIQENSPHSYDVVLVDSLYMTLYRELLPSQTVLLEQNIESQIFKQFSYLNRAALSPKDGMLWNATWRMMELYENRVWGQFSLRATVSEHDKQEMDRRCSSGKTIVVENGVNLEQYHLLPLKTCHTLLFAGALDYFPNTDAVFYLLQEIMPHVWRTAPDFSVIIAGKNPPHDILALDAPPRVHVVANPHGMEDVARRTRLSVVPLRIGSGTRLKILEAFAWGLPVVTTSIGCQGLRVTDGRDLMICDDPAELAEAILQLGSEAPLYNTLRKNGRALVEQEYGWQTVLEPFEAELATFAHSQTGVTL